MMTQHETQGPQVVQNSKKTKRYTKRSIAAFIIGVGALIAFVTMQTEFLINGSASEKQDRNYRMPQPEGFVDLAASMRHDRKPLQMPPTTPVPESPKERQRIVVEERQIGRAHV